MKHIVLFHFLIATFFSFAQEIPIGQWRVHVPYNSSVSIAVSNTQIYSSSGPGVFYINREDNSINPLSKITGLSDINVSQLGTDPTTGITVLAYSDGNIDLLKKGSVTNVSDVLNSPILESKTPSYISFFKGYAYICYPFGIVVLDINKGQIKESYINLSSNGAPNPVFSCTAYTSSSNVDSIYATTQNGVIGAQIASTINLMDYTNWHAFTSADGLNDNTSYVAVANYNEHTYVLSRNKLYVYTGTVWDTISLPLALKGRGKNLGTSNGLLVISAKNTVLTYNGSAFTTITDPIWGNVINAIYDNNGILWTADSTYGLQSKQGNAGANWQVPNGPYTADVFRLYEYNGTVIGMPGGYQPPTYAYVQQYIQGGYYSITDGYWSNYYNGNGFPNCRNIVAADYNTVNGNLYFASYNTGLVTQKTDGSFTLSNSISNPPAPFIDLCGPGCCGCTFISDVAHDSKGNEWVTLGLTNPGTSCLFELTPQGIWNSVPYFGSVATQYPILLQVDDYDNKWITFRAETNAPIIVYNNQNVPFVSLQTGKGLGNLPSMNIYSIAKDLNGAIWVGTDNGIGIFQDPSQVFQNNKAYIVDATIPIYQGYPLLFQQTVQAIAVDGGNRKWIGTTNGVWLFNEDGSQPLLNFTSSNSPLLSNNILDIAISSTTGEVFFATDKGLISYRGTATAATKSYSKVKVFPNPVPHSYDGTIGISGLAENADVKITDIYGNLVYETHASGGTAVWNGRNYTGKAADSGVYLIFSSLDDGTVSLVSKFAVIE